MEKEGLITPGVVKTRRFKVKIQWDNGGNETIYSLTPPNVNPLTPMLMDFTIKSGYLRCVNHTKVRSLDVEVYEENEAKLIL